jgi:hypothetical protein
MSRSRRILATVVIVSTTLLVITPGRVLAQQRDKDVSRATTISVTLSSDMQVHIREFYSARESYGATALPPGIRKRLARGKGLPPGIAKKAVPDGLRSRIRLPEGYEIVEIGLDVLLVEVATNIVHDVLMDVVR